MKSLRVASAQINTTVGDIDGNCDLILGAVEEARSTGCDIIAFPELCVTGYPPEDLLLSERFIRENRSALDRVAKGCRGIAAAIGMVDFEEDDSGHITKVFNGAAIVADGDILAIYHKNHLPNYGVFDELRYFTPGDKCHLVDINGVPIGINVCEDIWVEPGPADAQCLAGAKVIFTLNSSPYEAGKLHTRLSIVSNLAKRYGAYAVYTNQVGGQDELVFDGGSIFVGPDGETLAIAPRFEEAVTALDLDISETQHSESNSSQLDARPIPITVNPFATKEKLALPKIEEAELDTLDEIYAALVMGTRDYISKTGFQKVAIALSGGIDSSLVACIGVDAIGAQNVTGVSMPSRYSSEGSIADAQVLADRLKIPLWRVPIEPAHAAFDDMLESAFEGTEPNVAEENVQSRIRGNVMMTIANKFGWLVLTTGNKSEMATGYATLYGDMAGGFAVIKDIPKQTVYELAERRNEVGNDNPIPRSVIEKPPSAELKPDQTDQDSLPPYSVLDRILHAYIEERKSAEEIIRDEEAIVQGEAADADTVIRIVGMVDRNEYKRRQSPPGVKITGLAFGRDRRLPIASRWRHAR